MSFDHFDPASFHYPSIGLPLSGAQMRANRVHVRDQDRRLFAGAAAAVLFALATLLSWKGEGSLLAQPFSGLFLLATVGAALVMVHFDIKVTPTLLVAQYSLTLPLRGEGMAKQLDEWSRAYPPVRSYLALVNQQLRPVMAGDYCFLRDWVADQQPGLAVAAT